MDPKNGVPPPLLTVLLLALNERGNIGAQLDALRRVAGGLNVSYELLVVDGGSTDGTAEEAEARGARVLRQMERGYGRGLALGLREARGRWIITMDADLSHPAPFLSSLWEARHRADLVIASRFIPGARFEAPFLRRVLSRLLNLLYSKGLSLPVRDASSGYRLYAAGCLQGIAVEGVHFEALEEVLIKVFMAGRALAEVPFHYAPRGQGRSKARVMLFGWCLLKAFFRLRRLRRNLKMC